MHLYSNQLVFPELEQLKDEIKKKRSKKMIIYVSTIGTTLSTLSIILTIFHFPFIMTLLISLLIIGLFSLFMKYYEEKQWKRIPDLPMTAGFVIADKATDADWTKNTDHEKKKVNQLLKRYGIRIGDFNLIEQKGKEGQLVFFQRHHDDRVFWINLYYKKFHIGTIKGITITVHPNPKKNS